MLLRSLERPWQVHLWSNHGQSKMQHQPLGRHCADHDDYDCDDEDDDAHDDYDCDDCDGNDCDDEE